MLLTINPDLSLLVEQPLSRLPLAAVKLPRGSKVPIWVQFARDAAVIDPSEALTSGTLVVGLYYKITTFVAGDSFTNVGAASNATSVYFLCTGTTPTTWTNSSTLQQCDSAGVLFSLIFSVKKHQEYDGAVLVLASGTDFTKFGTGTSTIFKSKCSFSTAEINTLLGVDASVANDESEVTLMGEVSWLGPDESKAFPFQIDLQNDSYKVNDVVTSTPGVQAMSLVTTSSEALLPGSRVLTAGSNIAITTASGIVTIASTSGGTVTSVAQSFTGGIISVAGSPITASGTLALTVAGTSGGIPYFSSGTTWATSAALAANALVVGGGAGQPPATVTTGANVLAALGVAVGSAGAFITFDGDAGTPSALVGTNITGTAAGLTAGNATLAATVTVADEAADTTCFPLFATDATGSLAAMSNAGLTFNSATGLLSATGLAGAFNGTVGATTPDTVAGTTGTFDSTVTVGANSQAGTLNVKNSSGTTTASIDGSDGSAAFGYQGGFTGLHIDQFGNLSTNNNAEANLFAFNASNYVTAAAGAITLGTNTGTAAWIHSNGSASFGSGSCTIDQYGSASFASGTATPSLLLGTAGSAVGTIGFNNATSGTTTLAPATGALGTGTVTLPLSGTLATLDGSETLTNKSIVATQLTGTIADARNTVSNSTTTSMTAVTTLGAAGVVTNMPGTTSASSATTGALTIGNGTAATNVGIGGGNINAGGNITAAGAVNSQYFTQTSGRLAMTSGAATNLRITIGSTSGWAIIDNQSGVGGALLLGGGSINPGIFRSGTTLQVRLADNSADAPLTCSNLTASGTLAVTGASTFTGTLTASATTSLLLGTAGSAVGNIGFRNATSGTTTLQPATGALGTGTVTLPLSGTLATLDGSETLANKRITQRTGTATSSATPTINTDNVDFYSLTAQAADITSFTTNLSGTPTEGQTLWIAITGTAARAITWGAKFEAGAVALPTTTVTTTRLDVAFVWNTVSLKWRCMASG